MSYDSFKTIYKTDISNSFCDEQSTQIHSSLILNKLVCHININKYYYANWNAFSLVLARNKKTLIFVVTLYTSVQSLASPWYNKRNGNYISKYCIVRC